MTRFGFEFECEIAAPIGSVRAFLCDLNRLSALHPLIESIEAMESPADRPRARFWRVVDRIPLGPLHIRMTYVASLEEISDFEIVGEAWQVPKVELRTVYTLTPLTTNSSLASLGATGTGERTRVAERVAIRAPLGLRRFVVGQARAAHEATLGRVREELERRHPRSGCSPGEGPRDPGSLRLT